MEWTALRFAWINQLSVDPGPPPDQLERILLCRCQRSQLQFFWPPSLAASASFYERLEALSWYYRSEKWEYTETLKLLNGPGRLLDVGCGHGDFLQQAKTSGWIVSGLELNQQAADHAKSKGLDVYAETLESATKRWPAGVDVATAFQVLEHIAEPVPFLTALVKALRPGGRLVIGVPDSAGWIDRVGSVTECPPHHVTRWNGAALQFITRILPIDLEAMAVEPLDPIHATIYARAHIYPVTTLKKAAETRPMSVRILARFISIALRRSGVYRRLSGSTRLAIFVKRH